MGKQEQINNYENNINNNKKDLNKIIESREKEIGTKKVNKANDKRALFKTNNDRG